MGALSRQMGADENAHREGEMWYLRKCLCTLKSVVSISVFRSSETSDFRPRRAAPRVPGENLPIRGTDPAYYVGMTEAPPLAATFVFQATDSGGRRRYVESRGVTIDAARYALGVQGFT